MARDVPYQIRLSVEERELLDRAAAAVHPRLPASAWAREVLLREAERILQPPTDPTIQAELGAMVRALDDEGEDRD